MGRELPSTHDYEISNQLGSMFQQKFMSSEMMDSTLSGPDQNASSRVVPLTLRAGADPRHRTPAEPLVPLPLPNGGKPRTTNEKERQPVRASDRSGKDAGDQSRQSANRGTQASLIASFEVKVNSAGKSLTSNAPTQDE